jgi:signal transduction histidine kinase
MPKTTLVLAGFAPRRLSLHRQLSEFRQSTSLARSTRLGAMLSSLEVLTRRERLRVGERFLRLRPRIALVGAAVNAALLSSSGAPASQRLLVGLSLGGAVAGFFVEAWWLSRQALTERWLQVSLALTLLLLGAGAGLSGGLTSPVLPLLFAPVVIGFAAFARTAPSAGLLFEAVLLVLLLGLFTPTLAFPPLPDSALRPMLGVSCLTSLSLLAVGVIGLVDAHARVASELNQLRADLLEEAERRAASVEHLGAQVAHEVKNPLTAARGLVQLVERHTTDERDQQRLGVVVTEVDRALAVLGDYLSFARPLSDLALAPVELTAVMDDVAGVLEARAHEKSLEIRIGGEPFEVVADRKRLRDAVLNLALNAVTALPEGGTLELTAVKNHEHATLTIADNGPGMSAEQLAQLGQPFASRTEGGTGLGVLLAESVARQHGGSLRFESTPGAGTRAMLQLPLRRVEPR